MHIGLRCFSYEGFAYPGYPMVFCQLEDAGACSDTDGPILTRSKNDAGLRVFLGAEKRRQSQWYRCLSYACSFASDLSGDRLGCLANFDLGSRAHRAVRGSIQSVSSATYAPNRPLLSAFWACTFDGSLSALKNPRLLPSPLYWKRRHGLLAV